jgi:hypothetical protein
MSPDPRRFADSEPVDPDDRESREAAERAAAADEVPVPPMMSPAEVDERAQVVETLGDDEVTP